MTDINTTLTEIVKNLRFGEIKFKYLKKIADEKFAFEEVLKLIKKVSDLAIVLVLFKTLTSVKLCITLASNQHSFAWLM